MAKQTSIEWFIQELFKKIDYIQVDPKLIEQAKQMHKDEIISAYCDGGADMRINTYMGMHTYYEKTYGGNNDTK